MKLVLKIAIFGAIVFGAGTLHAQFLPEEISLFATPSSPSPGETFEVQASTPTFDKNTFFFQWSVDGVSRPDLSGMGKSTIQLTAGSVGSATRVNVTASHPREGSRSASLSIRVSDLSLSWSAETYVPRWYKGKALPIQNSVVRVVAVPQVIIGGAAIDPDNLIYLWSLDDEDRVLSGAGERVLRVRLSNFPRATHRVSLVVEDRLKRIRKEKSLLIEAEREPRLAIYEVRPLGGVEPRSVVSFAPLGTETVNLLAEPFFFGIKAKRELFFSWRVDGNEISGSPENPFLLTLNLSGRNGGLVTTSANAKSQNEFLPSASKTLNLFIQ